MKYHLKIGDFVKLTGSSLKTVLYYHKVGLLPEPKRTPGGYRLYGSVELTRMRQIKHLKSLGLDLERIKAILGDAYNYKTLREALESLRVELLNQKRRLEERVVKVDTVLSEDTVLLDKETFDSPSFQMTSEILGADYMEKFSQTCPEVFEQQRKLFGIVDDFQWGEEYHKAFRGLAEYFKAHPQEFQISLDIALRQTKLSQLSEDDPEIEVLARQAAEIMKKIPRLIDSLALIQPLKILSKEMLSEAISPAQVKYYQLLKQYCKNEA